MKNNISFEQVSLFSTPQGKVLLRLEASSKDAQKTSKSNILSVKVSGFKAQTCCITQQLLITQEEEDVPFYKTCFHTLHFHIFRFNDLCV